MNIHDYIRRIEDEELPRFRHELSALESGKFRFGKCEPGEEWRDTTPEIIAQLRHTIATYEGIAQQLRAEFSL